MPAAASLRLKDPAQFRYIGKDSTRSIDGHDIATGRAQYGIDVRLDGMLYAVIARPPVFGGKLAGVDSTQAMKVPGVIKVVELAGSPAPAMFNPLGGVAVIATNTWSAIKGREALKLRWDDGPNASYESGAFRATMEKAASQPGKVVRNQGDTMAALSGPGKRVTAQYYLPHIAHATMEPPVATARIADGKCEVWTSVQAPQATSETVAGHLGLKPEDVTVHVTLLGGGFGRKSAGLRGRGRAAVQGHGWQAGQGNVDARRRSASRLLPHRLRRAHGSHARRRRQDAGMAAPHRRLHHHVDLCGRREERSRVRAWHVGGEHAIRHPQRARGKPRSGGAHPHRLVPLGVQHPHAFAVQSFAAELATAAGRDHRDYLLALLGPDRRIDPAQLSDTWNYGESPQQYPLDIGRLRGVIELATREAGWGKTLPKGRGLGLAVCYSFVTYVAAVVEVVVADDGSISVPRIDMAVDCGAQVNPDRIRSQVEGACIMGISLATTGEITFKDGRAQQDNFHQYEVMRAPSAPRQIHVHLVPGRFDAPLGGVGEPAVPTIAPALCNAIFAATGKRIRALPIREQLKKA